MKIYMDNCCYNRPFDGYTDDRANDEAAAVRSIIKTCKKLGYSVIGSPVVFEEVNKTQKRNPEKWKQVIDFYNGTVNKFIDLTPEIMARGQEFFTMWPQKADCYHLALAEAAYADFLITTDDRFINANKRLEMCNMVRVINPKNFLEEIENGSGSD